MGFKRSSRTVLSSVSRAALTSSSANALIASNISWSGSRLANSNLGLPISSLISLMNLIMLWLASWPAIIALYISSSDTQSAPASIIAILSLVEATVVAILLTFLCSSVGLITYSPSIIPTEQPEIGPFHGTSEIEIAIEAPIIATISGWQSGSTLITVQTIETSLRILLSKRGRIGRSITRLVRIACSEGLPSLLR